MRKYYLVMILVLITLLSVKSARAKEAVLPSPNEIISVINQYRQQNGLSTLTYNPLLSSLAQQQSDYQAQISSITHTGPGGTTPQERAEAAGYGGGSWFYLSEIIYGGTNATPESAITWWKNSSVHNYYILSANYTEIGAGVATDGSMIFFTAELGGATSSGGSGSNPTSTTSTNSTGSEATTEPAPIVIPVTRSTPISDGTVHHIVKQGQSLWTIAAIYETTPEKIIELNGLETTYIFPGDNLIISLSADQPSSTTTVTITAETPQPTLPTENTTLFSEYGETTKMLGTPFSMMVEQPSLPPEPSVTTTPIITPSPAGNSAIFLGSNPIVSTLVIAAVGILVLVVLVSGFIQNKPGRPPRDDLVN